MGDRIKSYKLSPQLRAELNFQVRSGRSNFNNRIPFTNPLKNVKIPWKTVSITIGIFLIIVAGYIGVKKTYEYTAKKAETARIARLEEYNKHVEEVKTGVAKEATDALSFVTLSQKYLKSGDAERAEAAAVLAPVKDPKWRDGYINLGQVYLSINKFDLAKQSLDKALAIDPFSGQAHYLLSLAYQELNDSNGAKAEFAKAKAFGFETELGG